MNTVVTSKPPNHALQQTVASAPAMRGNLLYRSLKRKYTLLRIWLYKTPIRRTNLMKRESERNRMLFAATGCRRGGIAIRRKRHRTAPAARAHRTEQRRPELARRQSRRCAAR